MTLSRIVPSNSSTSWGTSATRAAQLGHRNVGDRYPTEGHRAVRRLDESQQQPGERRLAAAGASDDADGPTTGDVDIDVVENRLSHVVGEPDGAAGDAQRTRRRRGRAAVDDRRLDAEQLDDAVHRSVGLLDHLELIGELLQRADHQVHVLEQQERGTQRDRPIADEGGRQHQRADESDGDIDLQRPPHPQERRLPCARRW